MIIQCDKCATKFRLDESRITGNGVKVRCTKCQNVFIVTPPPPQDEAQLEEVFGITTSATAQQNPRQARPRPEDKLNLKFDFGKGPSNAESPAASGSPAPTEPQKDDAAGAQDNPEETRDEKKIYLNDIDFSFARGPAEGPGAAQDEEEAGQPASPPQPADEPQKPAQKPERQPVDFDFSFDEEEKPNEAKNEVDAKPAEARKEEPPQSAEEGDVVFTVSIGGVEKKVPREEFSEVLSDTMAEGGEGPSFDEGAGEAAEARGRGTKGLIAALVAIVFAAGAVYFTGVIDMLARSLMPPAQQAQKSIEIETVRGFFTENKNFGRFFVIEAKIKNITDHPQEIKAATGIIYDKRGEKIASRSVSPGRVLTPDDLKNLSSAEIQRAFKDPTGGTIPPKGVVPVMVPFTEVPEGLAECGIDVVR